MAHVVIAYAVMADIGMALYVMPGNSQTVAPLPELVASSKACSNFGVSTEMMCLPSDNRCVPDDAQPASASACVGGCGTSVSALFSGGVEEVLGQCDEEQEWAPCRLLTCHEME